MAKHRWAEKYPYLGTGTIETSPAISPEVFAEERDKIFKNTWLMVGRVEEIAQPGEYKVRRLDFAQCSAIVIRGKDDKIRAFYNVCSHRCNKVIVEDGCETYGRRPGAIISCRFHGWAFDATGKLVHVPGEDGFYGLDKDRNGLTPIHCDIWAGFVFINLAAEPKQSLPEFLGEYGDTFGDFPFEKMPQKYAYSTELNCNWKIAVDAFSEAYHVDTIHGTTFPGAKAFFEDIRLYRDHRVAALCANFTQSPSPVAALSHGIAKASVADTGDISKLPEKVNPGKRKDFINEIGVLFPSLLLHVTEGIWFTHQFWPISHNRTRWEGYYYVAEPNTHSELWAIEHAQLLQRNAWLEDTATMEATQEAMESGAKSEMHLQDDEILIRHAYHVLDRHLTATR